MSVETLAVVLHHSNAIGSDKVVLIGIANHDGDGGAWPSIATLAKYSNTSENAVTRSINRLVEAGELEVERKAGGGAASRNDRRTNRYTVRVTCPPGCDRTTNHRVLTSDRNVPIHEVASTPGRVPDVPIHEVASTPGRAPSRGGVDASHEVASTPPEPSVEPKPPQPPASGGSSCARHTTPQRGCRGCGTTQRQQDKRDERGVVEQRRADDADWIQGQRARSHRIRNAPGYADRVANAAEAARAALRRGRP